LKIENYFIYLHFHKSIDRTSEEQVSIESQEFSILNSQFSIPKDISTFL